jgi:GNAT superfamily N-acetyltransferase
MAMTSGASDSGVSRCREEDIAALRDFQAQMYGEQHWLLDQARFEWLFVRHPYRSGQGPAIWICRRHGQIVGTEAGIPFALHVGGERYEAFWGIELMVAQPWRGQGVGPAVSKALRSASKAACGLSLSGGARRLLVRTGSTDMGTMPMYVRLTDARGYGKSQRAAHPVWAAIVPVVRPALWLLDRICDVRSRELELLPVDAFDSRADVIWRRASPSYRILSRRDTAWLQWRFDDSPDRLDYRRFYVVHDHELVGYVVLRRTIWSNTPALAIVDYLIPPHHIAATLARVTRIARAEHVSVLLCNTLNPRARRPLRSVGFLRRRNQGFQFVVYTPDDDGVTQLMRNPSQWFLTSADSDIEVSG